MQITALNLTTNNCRVCLELPEEVLDTSTIYNEENLTYADCFLICTQIDLTADDDLPHNLCKPCALELQMSYDFYTKVEASKRLLQQYKQRSQLLSNVDFNKGNSNKSSDNTKFMDNTSTSPEHPPEIIQQIDEILINQDPIESIDGAFVRGETENDEIEEHLEAEEFQSLEELEDEDNKRETENRKESDYDDDVPVNLETHFKIVEDITIQKEQNRTELNQMKGRDLKSALKVTNSLANHSTPTPAVPDKSEIKMHNYPETAGEVNAPSSLNKRTRHIGSYECNYCRKSFPNYSRMTIHQRSHDVDRPKFSCEFCGRMYSTKQALEVHIRAIHIKSGFSCTICGKIFPVKKSLEIHMRYHTGDFPYVCDLCGRKFAQMCHLNTHKKIKHDSVRFSCDYPDCGKYFTSSNSLRNHEYTHHNMMPFECEFCQQGYPAKAKLKVHIKRKHGQDMSKEQLENMRKFHVMRSKVNFVKVIHVNDI
uniref:Uncharacterized protein n=1 Tax=Glossina morsitans morsitans TaxID=37546 RepID=A0A1B0G6T1_GLOMM